MSEKKTTAIRLRPWIGEKYGKSTDVFRQKTLILGGSQYSDGYEDFHKEGGQAEWLDFTSEVVHYYFDESIKGRWKTTYTNFINSIFCSSASYEQRGQYFDEIVFYNYLQEIAGATANDAANFDYHAPNHFAAFLEVIEQHRPEVVISWGEKVWNALPNDWGYGPAVMSDEIVVDGNNAGKIFSYPYKDSVIRLFGVRHPSIGFGREFHHQIFQEINILS